MQPSIFLCTVTKRIEDLNILFKLRFVIKDLYFQLEKLKNNIGGFLSIDNLMSTTTNRNIWHSYTVMVVYKINCI